MSWILRSMERSQGLNKYEKNIREDNGNVHLNETLLV